jgi:hypothetical protein
MTHVPPDFSPLPNMYVTDKRGSDRRAAMDKPSGKTAGLAKPIHLNRSYSKSPSMRINASRKWSANLLIM